MARCKPRSLRNEISSCWQRWDPPKTLWARSDPNGLQTPNPASFWSTFRRGVRNQENLPPKGCSNTPELRIGGLNNICYQHSYVEQASMVLTRGPPLPVVLPILCLTCFTRKSSVLHNKGPTRFLPIYLSRVGANFRFPRQAWG
jgi:hypothetical protein